MTIAFRLVRFLGNALLVLFALGALGSLFPAIPALGEVGPLLTANLGPWVTIMSLIGAFVVFRRWRSNRKRGTAIVAGMAAFAALGTGYVQAQQIGVAQANGAQIDLGEALSARSQAEPDLKPETVIYSRYDGQDLPLDIYRPLGSNSGKPAPVFVYVHGGGWGGETLKQRQADYRWFAARGYLVVSLEYPLSSKTRPTWNVAEPQLGCALAWLGANAARYRRRSGAAGAVGRIGGRQSGAQPVVPGQCRDLAADLRRRGAKGRGDYRALSGGRSRADVSQSRPLDQCVRADDDSQLHRRNARPVPRSLQRDCLNNPYQCAGTRHPDDRAASRSPRRA